MPVFTLLLTFMGQTENPCSNCQDSFCTNISYRMVIDGMKIQQNDIVYKTFLIKRDYKNDKEKNGHIHSCNKVYMEIKVNSRTCR